MLLSMNWIRDYVDLDGLDPDELDRLANGSVVMSVGGRAFQREPGNPLLENWWTGIGEEQGFTAIELTNPGPVTVLWEGDK